MRAELLGEVLPQPDPQTKTDLTKLGKPPSQGRQWYQRIDAVHELTDGRLVATERDCHPDSIAEAFRRRITVLELQQIIGRGRGLWRTAELSPQREMTIRVAV